jgi:quercetin dioxygenase-like cupin family protein
MEYVRRFDPLGLKADAFDFQVLADLESCMVVGCQGPSGSTGFPRHIHSFDQFYFVLDGTLTIEVANRRYEADKYDLVVLPAGVPHRNWNAGPGVERHIALLVPEPDAGAPCRPAASALPGNSPSDCTTRWRSPDQC